MERSHRNLKGCALAALIALLAVGCASESEYDPYSHVGPRPEYDDQRTPAEEPYEVAEGDSIRLDSGESPYAYDNGRTDNDSSDYGSTYDTPGHLTYSDSDFGRYPYNESAYDSSFSFGFRKGYYGNRFDPWSGPGSYSNDYRYQSRYRPFGSRPIRGDTHIPSRRDPPLPPDDREVGDVHRGDRTPREAYRPSESGRDRDAQQSIESRRSQNAQRNPREVREKPEHDAKADRSARQEPNTQNDNAAQNERDAKNERAAEQGRDARREREAKADRDSQRAREAQHNAAKQKGSEAQRRGDSERPRDKKPREENPRDDKPREDKNKRRSGSPRAAPRSIVLRPNSHQKGKQV